MRRKEKQIYKSGRKNPDGYFFSQFTIFDNQFIRNIVIIVAVIIVFYEVLSLFGVISWNKLTSGIGIVDGLKKQDSNFAVYYLDVGQSDCTIITCDDEVMLIDSGTSNQGYNIRTSLFTLGIEEIDYMVITHQHDDHMGAAAELLSHYSVSNIMMPKIADVSSVNMLSYDNLLEAISENDVNPIPVSGGESFTLGSALVEVLSPIKQDDNLNNMSVVLKVTYGETSFLFLGDSEKEIEKQLLRSGESLSADVLKVGHHGSATSSHESFLEAVNPTYAVISCGDLNSFGHPHSDVINRLLDYDIVPYITSFNGNIIAASDGKNVKMYAEKETGKN